MDEVIVCKCGGKSWIIGTGGTRCSNCGFWLKPEGFFTMPVYLANEVINGEIGFVFPMSGVAWIGNDVVKIQDIDIVESDGEK